MDERMNEQMKRNNNSRIMPSNKIYTEFYPLTIFMFVSSHHYLIQIPLPLRILIPIIYNTSLLAYLWSWVTTSTYLGRIGLGLGVINIVYWALNLFAFLIPIASVRYMRAYFFGVEAEEVTTRIGLEETTGLIPNYNS